MFKLVYISVSTGPGGQTIRVASPGTTILKTGPQGTQQQQGQGQGQQQGKQIITVHKGGQVANQPQIVTLVKTTQGMTVAQVGYFHHVSGQGFSLAPVASSMVGFLATP
jgi:hypothetical protein